MLTTSNTPKYAYLRKVAVLPLVAITLVLFSIQLSAQETKAKKAKTQSTAAKEQKQAALDQELAALDQKLASLDQQRAALDEKRAMLDQGIITPPTPPSPPAPPSRTKSITVDTDSMVIKGNRNGKDVTFTVNGSNKSISLKDQSNTVFKPSSGQKEKPLIVIDGVITSEINLNDLNPNNIQSMNVLKGEKATAKYAEKGANGVVEITTKKP